MANLLKAKRLYRPEGMVEMFLALFSPPMLTYITIIISYIYCIMGAYLGCLGRIHSLCCPPMRGAGEPVGATDATTIEVRNQTFIKHLIQHF